MTLTKKLQKIKSRLIFGLSRYSPSRYNQIVNTPYKELQKDDVLNFKVRRYKPPEIKLDSEDSLWKIYKINEEFFYWPKDYNDKVLPGIYTDVFAPADCNPHAYENDRVRISPGDWVIDGGACEGFFTRYALNRGANVVIIEPLPKFAEALSHTYEREIKDGKVLLVQGALGDRPGTTELMIPAGGPMVASIDSSWVVDENWDLMNTDQNNSTRLTVNVYTLDELLENGCIPKVDFLKLDIENAEVMALQGAKQTICSWKPDLSIAVYHDYMNAEIIKSYLLALAPQYLVAFRGIFVEKSYGRPRPYMLYAH